MSSGDVQARIAVNEAAFRRVNEAILAGRSPADERVNVICECGRLGCNRVLAVDRALYEATRANPRRFLVVGGHELPEAERVVERHGDLLTVEKVDVAGDLAAVTDPRTPLEDAGI